MLRILLLLALCLTCQGTDVFAQSDTISQFDEAMLLKHLKSLSSDAFEGRRTGTAGAIKTSKYIINQFHSLRVKALGKSFEQPFTFYKNKKDCQINDSLPIIFDNFKIS